MYVYCSLTVSLAFSRKESSERDVSSVDTLALSYLSDEHQRELRSPLWIIDSQSEWKWQMAPIAVSKVYFSYYQSIVF